MPEYDEKRKHRASSTPRKQTRAPHDRTRNGGRGKTPGEVLASLVRSDTNHDASSVKVHTDSAADQKARKLRARAVTEGQEIFFAKDAYQPSTEDGLRLVGHELAHGLQQAGDRDGSPASAASLEQEADRAGERLARGEPMTVRLRATPGSRLLKEEKQSAPSFAAHKEEIGPAPASGTISGPGFTIKYSYSVVKVAQSARLALTVPEGLVVSAAPLSHIAAGEIEVKGAGGVKARTVTIAVCAGGKGIPRVRVSFAKGSATYLVIFQFPAAAGK